MIQMNRTPPATCTGTTSTSFHFCRYGHSKYTDCRQTQLLIGYGLGLVVQRKGRRRLKCSTTTAQLSKHLSHSFGLDSQTFQSHDVSQLRWLGPVPGDIAEVEAYCRIFRAAEHLYSTLMDTMCNSVTGECFVSYDTLSGEKPLLVDKIASVLGCMLSLLNKGREDVLSGRSSMMASFRISDISTVEDPLPPLAVFRSEIKRCCESLHVALENYLTPGDDRSDDIWRKLQRLKNLCYDLGFSREDGSPDHFLFANWVPVYLSTTKEDTTLGDSDVSFWKGGQVTEEALSWLLGKGFRTIVDLRAETVKDNFYHAALHDAVVAGKIELMKLPVEIGTSPSMEQVEHFALVVSDPNRRPIYLHSREGVWRTSAMVSRWRQFIARYECRPINSSGNLAQVTNGNLLLHESSSEKKDGLEESKSDNCAEQIKGSDELLHEQNFSVFNKLQSANGTHSDSICSHSARLSEAGGSEVQSAHSTDINPLNSQLPPCNIFSRKEMSSYFKSRKISPSTFSCSRRLGGVVVTRDSCFSAGHRSQGIDMDNVPKLLDVGNANGSSSSKNMSLEHQRSVASGASLEKRRNISIGSSIDVVGSEKWHAMAANDDLTRAGGNSLLTSNSVETSAEDQNKNGESTSSPEDLLGLIDGNMCASATGVVRVQSRRKAEMFLVRTDGISCTREMVTESSLAFTHPSTQQQMLMWKSTPKTVLLLKKLGPELMEEAKEVASFLFYQEKMNVLVEPDVHDIFARIPGFGFVHTFYSQDTSDLHEKVDFVACLGGDGVILHASNLFRGPVPPVVSFNLGSLGFLTSHAFEGYKQDLRQLIHGSNTRDGVYITLRMRLHCEIFRNGKAMLGKVSDVLNEVIVDRGSNPYLSKIECYEHDRLITKVQGDGVIVATPTGSTAYSTAAGGSMVHPNVPCMLFTPICPHSLSFRPVILPDSARLELKIPEDARSNAWVSFDGKRRQQLSRGDSVRISMSQHPLPTVNKSDQTGDWFHSLIRCLNWNERLDQKAL
ncbi:NAD kinase 2, mitochondrial [Dionaea muscipula]